MKVDDGSFGKGILTLQVEREREWCRKKKKVGAARGFM